MDQYIKRYPEAYAHLPDRFIRKVEHDLNYIQEKNLPGLCRIYLFGSAARGEIRSTSDIDLLIIIEKQKKNREIAADIRWTLDNPIEGVRTDIVYKYEDSEKTDSVFDRELDRDKKLVLEVVG